MHSDVTACKQPYGLSQIMINFCAASQCGFAGLAASSGQSQPNPRLVCTGSVGPDGPEAP